MAEKTQEQRDEEQCQEAIREFDRLVSLRSNYDSHCQEIAQRVLPDHSKLFLGGGDNSTQGGKQNEFVIDAKAAVALPRFASIVDSILTPRNSRWQKVTTDNKHLLKSRRVKEYFEDVTRILFAYRYNPAANFTSQNYQVMMSLGAYGSSAMFTDRLRAGSGGLRYKNVHLSEFYWDENHQGVVDTGYRKIPLDLRQIKQCFPKVKLPDGIDTPANAHKKFQVIHQVKPRADYDPSRLDFKGKPFTSLYLLREKAFKLEDEGYDSFPYSVPKYNQTPGETTGRGPAMAALPAIKTANEIKKTLLKQGQRIVDPVLMAYDDGIIDGFSLKPGALNIGGVNEDGRPLIHTLPTGDISVGKDALENEHKIIDDVFLVSLFQILVENPMMSATEVLERAKEKGMLIVPTVGRIETEYLGTMGDRELDVLQAQRLLPEMPPELVEADGEYSFVYDSPFSRMQKVEQISGVVRSVESLLAIVNVTQDPAPLDYLELDEIVPGILEGNGVPLAWIKSMEKVNAIREGRAENAQTEQMIQAAPGAASVMKTLEDSKKTKKA